MKLYGVLVVFVAALLTGNAIAATFPVSNQTEFQNALDEADGNGENDIINVEPGTITLLGALYYNAQAGENYTLTIQGAGTGLTILDGDSQYAILGLSTLGAGDDSSAHISVSGITFQNGYSN